MTRWSGTRLAATLVACAAVWAVVATLCLCVGSTGAHWPASTAELRYRLEPVTVASIVGAALAAAGAAYQAVLRNPLADPYLLGASSGASLAAYLWQFDAVTALLGHASAAWATSQQAAAFAGAVVAVSLVLGVARGAGRSDPVTLLLVGVIVNSLCGSLFLLASAMHRQLPGSGGPLTFLVGGIQTVSPAQRRAAGACAAAGGLALLWLAGPLAVASLGDDEAAALGVRVARLRWGTLIVASLMTAAAVAVSGPIAFVGLICPHVARAVVGPDARRLLPTSAALGAVLLAAADALSRYLAAERLLGTELQVGIITGLLGGPFFLVLLLKGRRSVAG